MQAFDCKNDKDRCYFKGWYFKHQNDDFTISFIPGVQADKKKNKSAFVQVITDNKSCYVPYPIEEFEANKEERWIKIGKNEFSDTGIKVDIEGDGFSCKGDIAYGSLSGLKHNVMGPFRFLPFMECNHAVLSMKHVVAGELWLFNKESGNKNIVFGKGSSGYIEMDWGRSFPKSYSWIQCNRFGEVECNVMAAAAIIPLLGTKFTGCTCTVDYKGSSHCLATYKGAKVKYFNNLGVEILQGDKRLQIEVLKEGSRQLMAPALGCMSRTIHESPSCKARFRFSDKGKVYFDLISNQASFEYIPLS